MSDKVNDIAELLPEGMSEELVSEIAKVMQDVISERIDEEMALLTNKVHAFLRHQMNTVQEAALDELSESHEIYRDAQALKDIKSVLAFEIEREDIQHVASQIDESVAKAQQELAESIKENQRLERVVNNLEDKVESLNENVVHLQESKETLEEKLGSDFESTEKAIVITENVDAPVKDEGPTFDLRNPFLTEEVMAHMPNSEN